MYMWDATYNSCFALLLLHHCETQNAQEFMTSHDADIQNDTEENYSKLLAIGVLFKLLKMLLFCIFLIYIFYLARKLCYLQNNLSKTD